MNGCDAVVSSLGTGLSPFREVSLLTVATGALVTAMTRNGVRRLVCITPEGLRHLIAECGPGQIMLGTDYPFTWSTTILNDVLTLPGLNNKDKQAIVGENAMRLLKIEA